jgi:hypothetical protein
MSASHLTIEICSAPKEPAQDGVSINTNVCDEIGANIMPLAGTIQQYPKNRIFI